VSIFWLFQAAAKHWLYIVVSIFCGCEGGRLMFCMCQLRIFIRGSILAVCWTAWSQNINTAWAASFSSWSGECLSLDL